MRASSFRFHHVLAPVSFVAAFILATAGVSCGPPTPVTPLADYLSQNVELVCGRQIACGQVHGMAGCLETVGFGASAAQMTADVSAKRVFYDGQAATQCLEFERRHENDCDPASFDADSEGGDM